MMISSRPTGWAPRGYIEGIRQLHAQSWIPAVVSWTLDLRTSPAYRGLGAVDNASSNFYTNRGIVDELVHKSNFYAANGG